MEGTRGGPAREVTAATGLETSLQDLTQLWGCVLQKIDRNWGQRIGSTDMLVEAELLLCGAKIVFVSAYSYSYFSLVVCEK